MSLYRTKFKWVAARLAGRTVLDLGCVGHRLDENNVPWLHGHLCELADEVVGVDILDDEIATLRQRGYNVVRADVETMDLGRTFDAVVAGDIIEHLNSPGAMLERARAHLVDGGPLLIATPNPVTFTRMLRMLVTGKIGANRQHTCWFTAKVLRQLAGRYGFEVVDESYVDDTRLYYPIWPKLPPPKCPRRIRMRRLLVLIQRLLWRPVVWLNSLLSLLRPRCAETLCMTFQKGTEGPRD